MKSLLLRVVRIAVNVVCIAVCGVLFIPIMVWMAATGEDGATRMLTGDDWFWRVE